VWCGVELDLAPRARPAGRSAGRSVDRTRAQFKYCTSPPPPARRAATPATHRSRMVVVARGSGRIYATTSPQRTGGLFIPPIRCPLGKPLRRRAPRCLFSSAVALHAGYIRAPPHAPPVCTCSVCVRACNNTFPPFSFRLSIRFRFCGHQGLLDKFVAHVRIQNVAFCD
jgi:hypothetical protein